MPEQQRQEGPLVLPELLVQQQAPLSEPQAWQCLEWGLKCTSYKVEVLETEAPSRRIDKAEQLAALGRGRL